MNTKNTNWVGGFRESNKQFFYPNPDLTSLPMLDNMANINKLRRQQKVKWPEFSWEVDVGDPSTRCFQMFSPDISRIGYTNTGRVYSIICPQHGYCLDKVGTFNIEITVTSQRGWVDEDLHDSTTPYEDKAADMTVVGKIWFGKSAHELPFVKALAKMAETLDVHLPLSKDQAIEIHTHKVGNPNEPVFEVRGGTTDRFVIPQKANHADEAWSVGHIEIEIGDVHQTGDELADKFNSLIVFLFHIASGNILKKGSIVTWNVWFTPPEVVDIQEWSDHAEHWRKSIEADHGVPTGEGVAPYYADGKPFEAHVSGNEWLEIAGMLKDLIIELEHHNYDSVKDFFNRQANKWLDKL